MMRRFVTGLAMIAMLAGTLLAGPVRAAPAAADDPCPEPNDEFQQACYLGAGGDAVGFLGREGDVDAYRFEALDALAQVHVEIADRPLPYRVHLANWNGDVISSGPDGRLDMTLPMAGSYFVFVDSATGQFSDGVQYRLAIKLTYRGGEAPSVLYTREFRPGSDVPRIEPNASGTIEYIGGRVVLKMTERGEEDNPLTMGVSYDPDFDAFSLIVDARVVEQGAGRGGYSIIFRDDGEGNYYRYQTDARSGAGQLVRILDGGRAELTEWIESENIDKSGGVNRTVIRCEGDDIRVFVNGQRLISVKDDTSANGQIVLSVTTWGDPMTVYFDNLLVAAPGRR
jgi:hypothetical protein